MTSDTPVLEAAPTPRRRSGFWSRQNERSGYLFVLPAGAHLIMFVVVPILFSIFLSFREWTTPRFVDAPFVGLQNYIDLFSDGPFWHAIRNTLFYTALSVPMGMAASLGLAVMVNRRLPGINVFRAVFFLPVITSWVAVSVVWITLLSPEGGLLNYLFGQVGLPGQNWLDSERWAMFALVVITIWKNAGFQMVIWLAGLQSVPTELMEAAALDGAGRVRSFIHVTLPLLFPTTFFLLVTGVIGALQVFTPMYVITEGGPLGATDVAVYHIYQRAFEEFSMGYASAQAWVLFAIIFIATLIQLWYARRRGESALS
jgi:multiple sugar transport system permease protein